MADTLDELIAGIQNYVVAPLNAFGLGGFVFDVQGEAHAQLGADITDHYTEDNRALQDHIAIKPKRITLKGYVGELVYAPNGGSPTSALQQVTQKLTTISGYLPVLSAAATQAQQALANPTSSTLTLNSIEGALPSAANIYGLVKNALGAFGDMQNQQNAYNYFDSCRQQAILMGIQTPWEFLTNMAVETIEAIQYEESIFISDFSVTFKQIRIAQTKTATAVLSGTGGTQPFTGNLNAQGANAIQSQGILSQGTVPGVPPGSAILSGLAGQITSPQSLVSVAGIKQGFVYTPLAE